jgi:hypothetical protein
MSTPRQMLMEGLGEALGFVGGALAGYGVGLLLGWDIFAPGYSNSSIAGIVLVGLGGGLGRHLARRLRHRAVTPGTTGKE